MSEENVGFSPGRNHKEVQTCGQADVPSGTRMTTTIPLLGHCPSARPTGGLPATASHLASAVRTPPVQGPLQSPNKWLAGTQHSRPRASTEEPQARRSRKRPLVQENDDNSSAGEIYSQAMGAPTNSTVAGTGKEKWPVHQEASKNPAPKTQGG